MMMYFVVVTLAVMVGTLLASGLAICIALNTKVLKWYMKKVSKISTVVVEESLEKYFLD